MILSSPKAKNLKFKPKKKKKKPWTFSIITIHWAKPRSRKGKKCTDPSQNQCVYLNINTVTLIQISQKNKHKTKLGKKKGVFSAYQFWIVDDCRLCEIQKPGNYFWVRESLCEIESKFIGFYLCLYQVISHSFFFFFFFQFFIYMRHIHTTNSVWIINWN